MKNTAGSTTLTQTPVYAHTTKACHNRTCTSAPHKPHPSTTTTYNRTHHLIFTHFLHRYKPHLTTSQVDLLSLHAPGHLNNHDMQCTVRETMVFGRQWCIAMPAGVLLVACGLVRRFVLESVMWRDGLCS